MTLHLNGRSTFFSMDTGAVVTVISKKIYTKIGSFDLKTLDKMFKGPSGDLLTCKGRVMGFFQKVGLFWLASD